MYTLKVVKAGQGWNVGDFIEAEDARAKELEAQAVAYIVGGKSDEKVEPVKVIKARKGEVK